MKLLDQHQIKREILKRLSSKLLLDSLSAIVLTNKDELGNVAQDLCFDILIDCHHPILGKFELF